MAQGVDSTKTPARPSHEALENTTEKKTDAAEIDRIAMESAKRAENRIHSDEGRNPGTQEFTK